jgi:peptidoglycan/LPS O-acetylase OafA/YrhL
MLDPLTTTVKLVQIIFFKSTKGWPLKYRAEIDGLRAVAVLPVIFFHAGFKLFSSGFVGVDVFFVISGYLITVLILKEKEAGNFSLINFYERRARRILPALYAMLAACVVYAVLFLAPYNGQDFFQSVAATALFSQNFLLIVESENYFQLSHEFKPLLHIWSLAIEEQFYIVFPALISLIWWRNKIYMAAVFFALLLFSVTLDYRSIDFSDFYLPHVRAWELLAGVLVAFIYVYKKTSPNQLLLALGLSIILMATFDGSLMLIQDGFTSRLLAVIGTVLVILFGSVTGVVGGLLSAKPVVGMGLISYSAYLWHQPLLTFAKIKYGFDLGTPIIMLLIALTILISFLSWKYVEKPFRSKDRIHKKYIFGGAILFSVMFAIIGVAGHITQGFKTLKLANHSDQQKALYIDHYGEVERRSALWNSFPLNTSGDGTKKVIITVGDSMAEDVTMAIWGLQNPNIVIRHVRVTAPCFASNYTSERECITPLLALTQMSADAYMVIISSNLMVKNSAEGLVYLYEKLRRNGAYVKIVGALDFSHIADSSYQFIASGKPRSELDNFLYSKLDSRLYIANAYLSSNIEPSDFIDKYKLYCNIDVEKCHLYSDANEPYIFDTSHMTIEGLRYYGAWLEQKLNFSELD